MTPVLPQWQLLLSPSMPLSSLNPASPSALPPILYPSAQCVFSQGEDQIYIVATTIVQFKLTALKLPRKLFSHSGRLFGFLTGLVMVLDLSKYILPKNPSFNWKPFRSLPILSCIITVSRGCSRVTTMCKDNITAKGAYTSSRGPCLWYALARLSGSTSKAPRKS